MNDLTRDEQKRLAECMKDPKFMELLAEYTKEISDPNNRKETEEYLRQLEQEQGVLRNEKGEVMIPEACFCIETITTRQRTPVFVNICSSDKIGRMKEVPVTKAGQTGSNLSIPLSLGRRKDEEDEGKSYVVFDVVFHPETAIRALGNNRFRHMIIELAIETVEGNNSDMKLERQYKLLECASKGSPSPQTIRVEGNDRKEKTIKPRNSVPSNNSSSDLADPTDKLMEAFEKSLMGSTSEDRDLMLPNSKTASNKVLITELSSSQNENNYTVPKYTVVHRGEFDMSDYTLSGNGTGTKTPKELIIRICLPLLNSASGIDLDISESALSLSEEQHSYKLNVDLPYAVYESEAQAKFEKKTKTLVVTIPVRAPEKPAAVPFTEPIETKDEDEDERKVTQGLETIRSPIISSREDRSYEDTASSTSDVEIIPEPTWRDEASDNKISQLPTETSDPISGVESREEGTLEDPKANPELQAPKEDSRTIKQEYDIGFFNTVFTNRYLSEID